MSIKKCWARLKKHIIPNKEKLSVETRHQQQKEKRMGNKDVDIVESIYGLRNKFLIIGLTGRTGSGCSTVAELLSKKTFAELHATVPDVSAQGTDNENRKYSIIYRFIKTFWKTAKPEFVNIKASDVIMLLALKLDYDDFVGSFNPSIKSGTNASTDYKEIRRAFEDNIKDRYAKLSETANQVIEKLKLSKAAIQQDDMSFILDFLSNIIPQFQKDIRNVVNPISKMLVTSVFQMWGNNIRKYGEACGKREAQSTEPSMLAYYINRIIKVVRMNNGDKPTFIVIDSLRNPFEVLYFRERYSAFYLASINTEMDKRNDNLHRANFTDSDISNLDATEYPKKRKNLEDSYYEQDIEKCVEMSDIHIVHDNKNVECNYALKEQLIRYLALMLHPGLVSPTPEERLMQVALTAKLNSGCISRQVGAAITDENFSIKAIGWNTSPQGQAPCSLRSFDDLCTDSDRNAFSKYERENCKFRSQVKELEERYNKAGQRVKLDQRGLTLHYCFKDLYYNVTGEKNQVHTRSLHAEENAFLQLAKYGSAGICGGKLFTTASPCELCAKKAYQLGIKDIYYIDIYPGISVSHILNCGENTPTMHMFKGVTGYAYLKLYNPFMAQKDEIEYITGVRVKSYNHDEQKDKAKGEEVKGSDKD